MADSVFITVHDYFADPEKRAIADRLRDAMPKYRDAITRAIVYSDRAIVNVNKLRNGRPYIRRGVVATKQLTIRGEFL